MAVWIDLLDSVNQKYDNAASGLAATDVKSAIDELKATSTGNVTTPDAAAEGSVNITHVVGLTQVEYDASVKNANTLYVIVG